MKKKPHICDQDAARYPRRGDYRVRFAEEFNRIDAGLLKDLARDES